MGMAKEADHLRQQRVEITAEQAADARTLRERRQREDREVWELLDAAAKEFAAAARRRRLKPDERGFLFEWWWSVNVQIRGEHWATFRIFKRGKWSLGSPEYAGDGIYNWKSFASSEKPGSAPFSREAAEQARQALVVKLSSAD